MVYYRKLFIADFLVSRMNLELNLDGLREELETGREDSEKAYRLNCKTREVARAVVEMQPTEDYVKGQIVPLFEAAVEVIKVSSPKGGFAKHMRGFVNCIRERIDYLKAYEPILKDVLSC